MVADAAYSSKENIDKCTENEIQWAAKLNPAVYSAYDNRDDGFIYNKDAGTMQCPAGHLAMISKIGKEGGGTQVQHTAHNGGGRLPLTTSLLYYICTMLK